MRDPKRIRKFCARLAAVWEKVPDWRFGQLMSNVLGEYVAQNQRDIFFPEDEEMISFFEEYTNPYAHAPVYARHSSQTDGPT